MTYCLGLRLREGLVLLSDTRTNAGLDHISVYRKMYLFEAPGERAIAVLTAGNLSITQTTIAKLQHGIDAAEPDPGPSIMAARTMLEVAEIIGDTLAAVRADVAGRMAQSGAAPAASMIVGGQRKGGDLRLFLIYAEGNFIEATEDTPYLQIGEHKYGKPILDRVVTPDTSLEEGKKVALISMDSTLRSNLSVGMPLDLAVIRTGECRIAERTRIEAGDTRFAALSEAWSRALREGFAALP
jgi:putative proteasome-type protease